MITEFHKYPVAVADPQKLKQAHDIRDLKDERLLTSSEAFEYLKRLQRAEEIREAVRNYYAEHGIKGGWMPEIASVVHLESLVNQLAPVVALIEMGRQYPEDIDFACQLKTTSSAEGLQITATVPEKLPETGTIIAWIVPESDPMQEESDAPEPSEEFIEEYKKSMEEEFKKSTEGRKEWSISLSSTHKPADIIALCSKAISRYQFMDSYKLESLAAPFHVLAPRHRDEEAFSPEENAILLGVLQGLLETPFRARITDNGKEGELYTPSAPRVEDTEDVESALHMLDCSIRPSHGRHGETDRAKLIAIAQTSASEYLMPASPGWRVILSRAQEIEGVPNSEGDITRRNFREAVGRAFIEDLPLEFLHQYLHLHGAPTLKAALKCLEQRIGDFTHIYGANHPFVGRCEMVHGILKEMDDSQY